MGRSTASVFPTDAIELGDGRHVRVSRPIGKGAVSTVWKGVLEGQHGVRRGVALKLFGAIASDELEPLSALLANAATRVACVRHPNVVEVYDFGLWRGQPFFVEELVDGVTLAALMDRFAERKQRLPLDLALFIACEVAEGLSGARTARDPDGVQVGLLHLGFTAREVLLSWRGEVKVSDFDLSNTRSATSSVRTLRAVASRSNMLAPEVAQGQKGDARSDVFSLGVLLRELLVAPRFPKSHSHAEAIRLAREGHVEPVSFQPHLPAALFAVMDRALAVDPVDRYPNATALAYDLRRVALGMGVGDGRWFLRQALDHEWGNDAVEITRELPLSGALRLPLPTPPPVGGRRVAVLRPEMSPDSGYEIVEDAEIFEDESS